MAEYRIFVGDCLEVMKGLAENSIDSVVCDPPYGLGFMGKAWDHAVPGVPFWIEMLRVAKPGAYLLAFCGTRTDHRMKCAIEDAGWEIRDTIMWVYGSGFPKSHNGEWGGTALKPAWEPITLARKPVDGTVAKNFAKHGTGGLNIDGCRIGTEGGSTIPSGMDRFNASNAAAGYRPDAYAKGAPSAPEPMGRWPANLIHDGHEDVVRLFPQSDGQQAPIRGTETSKTGDGPCYGEFQRVPFEARGDTGSAARFFYCAKTSRKDRNEGCEGMEQAMPRAANGAENAVGGSRGSRSTPRENHHPTVKPTDLMRYLCRLVTPKGGTILDPFMGSGSTGKAATLEGFEFTGIELDPQYALIAAARIEAAKAKHEPVIPQPDLFGEEQAA